VDGFSAEAEEFSAFPLFYALKLKMHKNSWMEKAFTKTVPCTATGDGNKTS